MCNLVALGLDNNGNTKWTKADNINTASIPNLIEVLKAKGYTEITFTVKV